MLTILICTKNRSHYVARLLDYYASHEIKYKILIGDSSDEEHIAKIKDVVAKKTGILDITYREYPLLNGPNALRKMIDIVETPYAVYLGDDDFIIPSGIQKCLSFLENNKEYIGANGSGILLNIRNADKQCRGDGLDVGEYKLDGAEEELPTYRVASYLKDYFVVMFSVIKTEVWKTMYSRIQLFSNKPSSRIPIEGEILPNCLAVIQGKIKHLNCIYLARETHKNRYLMFDMYDIITDKEWPETYAVFRDALAEEITKIEAMESDAAKEFVKKIFMLKLEKTFHKIYLMKYKEDSMLDDIKSKIFRYCKQMANLYAFFSCRFIKNRISPYHKEYALIRSVIQRHNISAK